MNNAVLRIDIWSDLVCPWCWIGKHRLQRALTQLAGKIPQPVIDWHPFELDPQASTTPMPLRQSYIQKFGGLERTNQILAQTQATARAEGVMIDFDQNQVRVTTKLAHRVLWLAGQEGVAEPVSEALFQAHFVYGKNLADAQVLIEAAAAGNIAKARVEALLNSNEGEAELAHELEQARKQGVRSVPLFVINQHHVVEGAQPAEFLASFLLEIADETSISLTNDETRCGPDQCRF